MTLSDEDKALFRHMMATVKPLNKRPPLAPKTKQTPALLKRVSLPDLPISYELSDHYTTTVQAETNLSFATSGLSKKRLQALKKGEIPLEGRLDLHGLHPEAAKEALCHFIHQQSQRTHRCVLLIHGKGSRHGEAPVLKNHVNHWLKQLPQVIAFHSAASKDGGAGAVYILLKKRYPLHITE